jgi:hypothetical protein
VAGTHAGSIREIIGIAEAPKGLESANEKAVSDAPKRQMGACMPSRPLRGLRFEMLELMRVDLFEYLDVLTTSLYDDKKSKRDRTRDLRRIKCSTSELKG